MWIRETFSNSIDLRVIDKYDKGEVMQIRTVLGKVTKVLVDGSSQTWLFRHLSKYVLRVRKFEKTKAARVIFSPKMFKIELDFKKSAKNWEKSFGFEIITF